MCGRKACRGATSEDAEHHDFVHHVDRFDSLKWMDFWIACIKRIKIEWFVATTFKSIETSPYPGIGEPVARDIIQPLVFRASV